MKLGVGAVSPLVVEVAATLKVPQIVASRRQVNQEGGYIGMTPEELVDNVRRWSGGDTEVVRDHGGPGQGGFKDDGIDAFEADVAAGFDVLHIDVSAVPRPEQVSTLIDLMNRFAGRVKIEIGGERDEQEWLDVLLDGVLTAGHVPDAVVVDLGGHAFADLQRGRMKEPDEIIRPVGPYGDIAIKAHNMDWVGARYRYRDAVDYINIAPEFARTELIAEMIIRPAIESADALLASYARDAGNRWFSDDEPGDYLTRALCGMRYIKNDLNLKPLSNGQRLFVAGLIQSNIEEAT